jgi:hypothetical protein
MLLLILSRIPDKMRACEYALHFWYSTFIPLEYDTEIKKIAAAFPDTWETAENLGPTSTLFGVVTKDVRRYVSDVRRAKLSKYEIWLEWIRAQYVLISLVNFHPYSPGHRRSPSNTDMHHLHYSRLEPSHRLAVLHYRKTGVILPFGVRKDHFDHPNPFLFSPEGKWLEHIIMNPLHLRKYVRSLEPYFQIPLMFLLFWSSTAAVIETGRAHGAQRADVYGCLYFYLADELQTFADRLCSFHINFRVFSDEHRVLSKNLREGTLSPFGFPAGIKFDRIQVGDLSELAGEQMKISDILADWSPLLKENKHATLLCQILTWYGDFDEELEAELSAKLIKDGRVR